MESIDLSTNLIFLLRVIISGVCGIIIGYERKSRGKGAGVRTHMIVALASALMMIVSKYGFSDVGSLAGARGADNSRVAAQIVSGVGFLGAGMIYVHKNSISGLTTAAGIWATAGIGMAVGAGMYFIGIAATVLVFVSQIFLHRSFKFLQPLQEVELTVEIADNPEALEFLKSALFSRGYQVERFKTIRNAGTIEINAEMLVQPGFDAKEIYELAEQSHFVRSISV